MCGFFGVLDLSGTISPEDNNNIISGADAISYRGPDDSGFYSDRHVSLSFRRLSIIDVSAPSQPYFSEDKNIVMVCNGEIYNFRILKSFLQSKGHSFQTNTDSEIIVHGYEEWGGQLWRKLNGIFAIVIWDKKKQELSIVRDHLGVKPVHYMRSGSRYYFGSDYNAFTHQKNCAIELNKDAILSYLSFRHVIGEQSFYKDIKDVLPACSLSISEKGLCIGKYWDIPIEEDDDKGEKFYLEKLDEKISSAVERQLVSDVPVGAFISGGLDSSLLLYYICKKHNNNIDTFITGFDIENYNEFKYADIIARHLGLCPHKFILDTEEYMDLFDEVLSFRGEPVSVPHEAAFLKMSRNMKKYITVVLSGEGADELFSGYGRIFRSPFDYYKQKYLGRIPCFHSMGADSSSIPGRFNSPMEHFLWRYSWFTEEDKKNLLNPDYFNDKMLDDYSLDYCSRIFDQCKNISYYRTMNYVMGKIHLVNLLNRLDRMTMAASIEARVPFLDPELVELVSRMPVKYKLHWKNKLSKIQALFLNSSKISEVLDTPKYILKKLAENKIPGEIIYRKKMGFPVPLDNWFSNRLKTKAAEILLSSNASSKDFINQGNLRKFFSLEKFSSDYDYDGKKIWMLMNLELWLKKYFPNSRIAGH